VGTRDPSLRSKWPGHKVDLSLPSSGEVKNGWSYISYSQYMHFIPPREMYNMAEFMLWCVCHDDSWSKICLFYSKLLDAYTCVWPLIISITYTNNSHRHFIAKFLALYVGDCISTYKILILHGLLSVT